MHSLRELHQLERETFRNARTGQLIPVWPRYLAAFLISIFCASFWTEVDSSTLRSILTVLGVLVGFSFSIMFFLVSNPLKGGGISNRLEHEFRERRLEQLSKEIFINVSYFSFVTLCAIALGVLILLPIWAPFVLALEHFSSVEEPTSMTLGLQAFLTWAVWILKISTAILFWFSVLVSALSFQRIVRRVSFFFSERIALEAEREEV